MESGSLERCIASARAVGCYKSFHAITDNLIPGADCYSINGMDPTDPATILGFLKAGISRLPYDIYIWLDSESLFTGLPTRVPDCLRHSPWHIPLFDRSKYPSDCAVDPRHRDLAMTNGVYNTHYSIVPGMWMVRRNAVDYLIELSQQYLATARVSDLKATIDDVLSYATQLVCANPEVHLYELRRDLWQNQLYFEIASTENQHECENKITPAIMRVSNNLTPTQ